MGTSGFGVAASGELGTPTLLFMRVEDMCNYDWCTPPVLEAATAEGLEQGDYAAALLFSVTLVSSPTPQHGAGTVCHLHGLHVDTPFRRHGVATQLYRVMHALAFEESQRLCAPTKRQTPRCGHKRLRDHSEGLMQVVLGSGSCRRGNDTLNFLASFGWKADEAPVGPEIRGPYLEPWYSAQAPRYDNTFLPASQWSDVHTDLGACTGVNVALMRTGGKVFPGGCSSSRGTGVVSFHVQASFCRLLEEGVQRMSETPAGQNLFLPGSTVGLVPLDGYRGIHAEAVDRLAQGKAAVFTKGPADAQKLLQEVPAAGSVVHGALQGLGLDAEAAAAAAASVRVVHFFRVDKSNQTSYDWHVDCLSLVKLLGLTGTIKEREAKAHGIRTVVVQLGADSETAMCLWGFDPAVYRGRGAGHAFHGSAVHRGVPWNPTTSIPCQRGSAVWKMTLFWLPQDLRLPQPM